MVDADLRLVFREVKRVHAQLAAALNFRLRQDAGVVLVLFEPMAVIAETDSCRVRDLAAQLGVSAGGASKLVDRLEAGGYCRRYPNPRDRRSSLVDLTAAGRRTFAAARRAADDELASLLGASLSPAQVRELAAMLRELRNPGTP
jgi:MarR family transcriptional regulator, organic hydroperoxide resistance regulator